MSVFCDNLIAIEKQHLHRPPRSPHLLFSRLFLSFRYKTTIIPTGKDACGSKLITGSMVVGSGSDCDLVVKDALPRHAQLERKGGRLFCTALTAGGEVLPVADEMSIMPPPSGSSQVFIEGKEIRPGIAYMVAPNASLVFGPSAEGGCTWEARFEEQGSSSPMMEMMLRGMATSDEVKQSLEEQL